MFKIIAIIIGVLLPFAKVEQKQIKQPNYIITNIANSTMQTLFPKKQFSGQATSFTNLDNNILLVFNDGTTLQINNTQQGTITLELVETNNPIETQPRTNLATYTYSNYTYNHTTTDLRGIMFEDNYQINNIYINGVGQIDYTYFMDTQPDSEIANFTTMYMISNNTEFDNASYWQGWQNGYDIGFKDGQNDVLTSPSNWDLYDYATYTEKINEAYYEGVEDATNNDFSLYGLVSSILTAPAVFVKEAFNFEFFGVNIANLIMFFISLSIVIWIIGFFKKK